ncbi:hypothetical protein SAMN05421831_10182 [Allopseudospirillum japonicum]|uniref:Uncharacterized protein n=1 Tax=Allopseudospirillum japonicum TaxID=64971 RepID=A0A1H6QFF1_9GAMM|nr:folate-binding protein YgfZ [Allopseudospirillum japonicum]SEI37712.1 hypothetical protein SAMN05421831_10182 [Allopseudospirillum japonicum]
MSAKQLGILRVQGEKAATFLQGQVSCDMRQVTSTQAALGCTCDLKGRVLSQFIVWSPEAGMYWLILEASLIAELMQDWQKYLPFYAVTLTPETHWQAGIVRAEFPNNAHYYEVTTQNSQSLMINLGPQPYQVLLSLEVSQHNLVPLEIQETQAWLWFTSEHRGRFLPQMLNLQAWGGLNFKKGCYTGQEVVARAQHRGQVKKRLYLMALAEPAQQMYLDVEAQQVANIEVLGCTQQTTDQKYLALVVAPSKLAQAQTPIYGGGHEASWLPMPYDVEQRIDLPAKIPLTA